MALTTTWIQAKTKGATAYAKQTKGTHWPTTCCTKLCRTAVVSPGSGGQWRSTSRKLSVLSWICPRSASGSSDGSTRGHQARHNGSSGYEEVALQPLAQAAHILHREEKESARPARGTLSVFEGVLRETIVAAAASEGASGRSATDDLLRGEGQATRRCAGALPGNPLHFALW